MHATKIADYIQALPKAELHIHIEGSLEPELMFRLAERNGVKLEFDSIESLRAAYDFGNLDEFLKLYYQGTSVLQKSEDFEELMLQYFKHCKEENIIYTEIFFDPQVHLERGVQFSTMMQGFESARKAGASLGIQSKLIMCFLRDYSEKSAFETLELAEPFLDQITAVGLDSSEKDHPPTKFSRVFDKARQKGLKVVAHAGEEGPADYIWQAIEELRVDRIDHGVRCLEDSKLVEYLREKQIPLTVCPLSNVKLKVFNHLRDHNLKTMLRHGLNVSVHSDDPAYFGGYLSKNLTETQKELGLDIPEVLALAKNGFKSGFLSEQEIEQYLKQIDAVSTKKLEM